MAADPALWAVVEATMNALLMPTLAVIGDIFGRYDPMPFGLTEAEFTAFAMGQFQKRIGRIERARTASLDEIEKLTRAVIEADDA